MIKNVYFILVLVIVCLCSSSARSVTSDKALFDVISFCYHDVRSDVKGDLDRDPAAVNTEHLIEHFQWLKDNNYSVVTVKQIEMAREGKKPLPPKAVLLTFDDGYRSFYDKIYPLLKLYKYPATFGIVTSWIESETPIKYGKELKPTTDFLTWHQIKEMQNSGLIEIASHSHDLHKGVFANPQGNLQPAATSRIYKNGKYESTADYVSRIKADLKTSSELIHGKTGVKPTTMIWPYGSYSNVTWNIAKEIGYTSSLILENGRNRLEKNNEHISRFLISDNPTSYDFSLFFMKQRRSEQQRVVHVDLDYVFDPDEEQQNRNLDLLLDRIKSMQISTIYLQAFSDSDGDGNASALYFPNRHLPTKSDLFNRVAWQLKTRANVIVYAWMPVSAFDFGDDFYQKHGVKMWNGEAIVASDNVYKRLSIFDENASQIIHDIYQDLATYSFFEGIIFHDDAFLTDFEDVSDNALAYYRSQGMMFNEIASLRTNENIDLWASIKSEALTNFTLSLADAVKQFRPSLKIARNMYALPIVNPDSKQWFAQSLDEFILAYDYTAIMAMPLMEGADEPIQWFSHFLSKLSEQKHNNKKILIELQSKDWRSGKPVDIQKMSQKIEMIQAKGWLNYGYYPDDFIANQPPLEKIKPLMSLSEFPYEAR